MTFFRAIFLALLQGATEFLPVSSSAHLVLVPFVLGWSDQGVAFDVAVNTGTLVAVLVYFRRELPGLVRGGLAWLRRPLAGGAPRSGEETLAAGLILGSLPLAVAGAAGYPLISTVLRDPRIVASASIVFGLALGWADRTGSRRRTLTELGISDAMWIGLGQALALVPGTSRSGITMTVALLLGFERSAAARFSFLLAIPAGLMAAVHEGWGLVRSPLTAAELGPMAVGFLTAAVAAYLTIDWLLAWLERRSFDGFVVYRVVLGLAILAVVWWTASP